MENEDQTQNFLQPADFTDNYIKDIKSILS